MRRTSRVTIALAVVVSVGLAPAADAVSVRWQTKGGTVTTDAVAGPDGSIYASGSRRQSISVAATLRKFTPNGHLRWTRSWLPNPEASTHGVGVAVGGDGTIYLLGRIFGACEGGGWFVRAYAPGGQLRWKYLTPGWACSIAESATDIAVRGDLVVVSGSTFGCCGDPYHDGWVQSFDRRLHPGWRTDVEPPAPTPSTWYETASGVGIGSSGNVFVSGWAATAKIVDESSPTPGTPLLAKLRGNGARAWSRRADVPVRSAFLPIPIAVGSDRVAIGAGIDGRGTAWGSSPTTGWLASYTVAGTLRWQRRFGAGPEFAAGPTGLAFSGEELWVEGSRRDPGDRGIDIFIRVYGSSGALLDKTRIDPARGTCTRTIWAPRRAARRPPAKRAMHTAAPVAACGDLRDPRALHQFVRAGGHAGDA